MFLYCTTNRIEIKNLSKEFVNYFMARDAMSCRTLVVILSTNTILDGILQFSQLLRFGFQYFRCPVKAVVSARARSVSNSCEKLRIPVKSKMSGKKYLLGIIGDRKPSDDSLGVFQYKKETFHLVHDCQFTALRRSK